MRASASPSYPQCNLHTTCSTSHTHNHTAKSESTEYPNRPFITLRDTFVACSTSPFGPARACSSFLRGGDTVSALTLHLCTGNGDTRVGATNASGQYVRHEPNCLQLNNDESPYPVALLLVVYYRKQSIVALHTDTRPCPELHFPDRRTGRARTPPLTS